MINAQSGKNFKLTRGESIALAGIMERFMQEEGRSHEDMGA